MATQTDTTGRSLELYPLSVDQFVGMIDAGLISEDARVELVRGEIVKRTLKNTPHNFAVDSLADELRRILPPGWLVREEKSLQLDEFSRPEPDLIVARGPHRAYQARAPQPADVHLVIEVADTSYAKDRGPMWELYAEARIPAYWIVNLRARTVEVFGRPSVGEESSAYQETTKFGEPDEVPLVIEGREVGRIAVKNLLPRIESGSRSSKK